MGQKTRYTEIVLVFSVAFLAGWNYTLTVDNFGLPHKMAMYSVKPVLQHDRFLGSAATGLKGSQNKLFYSAIFDAKYEPKGVHGEFDFQYLSAFQVSKYVLGCYGAGADFGSHQPGSWRKEIYEKWAHTNTSQHATRMLDEWQTAATESSSGSQGVCTCIDNMAKETYGQAPTYKPFPAMQHANTDKYFANKYQLVPKPGSGSTTGDGRLHANIVEFCQTSAVPMHVVQYEGTVGIPALVLAAQLCILLGLLHVWDLFICKIHIQTASRGEGIASAHSSRRSMKIAVSVLLVLVYGLAARRDTDQFSDTDATQLGYRTTGHTHRVWSPASFVIAGALLIVLVVELVYEYVSSRANQPNTRLLFNKNSTMAKVVDRVGADVPTIVGFALLGMAILLQADVSNSTSVLGGVFILLTAGFVQHISNVVKILYESICSRLSSDVVVGLTLHDEASATKDNAEVERILKNVLGPDETSKTAGNKKVRDVLQFFGWTRLYLFLIVLTLAASFFTYAKDSTESHPIRGMLDGQVLYFSIVFLFANVGFDMMYELMPMQFENVSSDMLKIYFVCGYLVVFNLNQIMYIRSITGDRTPI